MMRKYYCNECGHTSPCRFFGYDECGLPIVCKKRNTLYTVPNFVEKPRCETCKHWEYVNGPWGTCTKPGQTMTEEVAAACGRPCWEAKD